MFLADIDIPVSTVLEVIEYLRTRYYKISTTEITQNDKIFCKIWDPEELIEAFFERIKDCVEFADDAIDSNNITDRTQIQVMMASMETIVEFKQRNREWKCKTLAKKKPINFRQHYINAYEELLEEVEKEAIISEMIKALLVQGDDAEDNEHQGREQQAHLATENEQLMDLIINLTHKVNALESRKGGRSDQNRDCNAGGGGLDPMVWQRVAPKEGEPAEKTVEDKKYKHCSNCRQGKGLWTTGEGFHGTTDHDPSKSRKK